LGGFPDISITSSTTAIGSPTGLLIQLLDQCFVFPGIFGMAFLENNSSLSGQGLIPPHNLIGMDFKIFVAALAICRGWLKV
jgi:hypothetical protein